jgi:membrane carboxypeptidase/penicillin-binding protein PbpC
MGAYLLDNADVRSDLMSGAARVLLGAAVLFASCADGRASPVAEALLRALRGTQASAVVLDLQTGAVLASAGESRRRAPGSTIKPLLLEYALEHGIVRPEMEVYCRRNLHVGGRALPCTHPADLPVFTAESALAESCNTWFAEMARRFSGPELEAALRETHLPHAPMDAASCGAASTCGAGAQCRDGFAVGTCESVSRPAGAYAANRTRGARA